MGTNVLKYSLRPDSLVGVSAKKRSSAAGGVHPPPPVTPFLLVPGVHSPLDQQIFCHVGCWDNWKKKMSKKYIWFWLAVWVTAVNGRGWFQSHDWWDEKFHYPRVAEDLAQVWFVGSAGNVVYLCPNCKNGVKLFEGLTSKLFLQHSELTRKNKNYLRLCTEW